MSLVIVTENLVFGETLTSTCHDRNIKVINIFENISSISRLSPDDLLLLHLTVGDASVIQQLTDLKNRFGEVRIVLLVSDRLSTELRSEAEQMATIVMSEREPADALVSALTLAELGYHLSAFTAPQGGFSTKNPEPTPGSGSDLSKREVTILGRLCEGMSNKSIALELGIREATVKVHLRSAYRKIGVSNRTQAALWASREFPGGVECDSYRVSDTPYRP